MYVIEFKRNVQNMFGNICLIPYVFGFDCSYDGKRMYQETQYLIALSTLCMTLGTFEVRKWNPFYH